MSPEEENVPPEKHELIQFDIEGTPSESWARLQGKLFQMINRIADKVSASTDVGDEAVNAGKQIAEDLTSIMATFAKAMLEKPTLENQKLKAEIAEKFANVKKLLAEAERTQTETDNLRRAGKKKDFLDSIELLERLFKLTKLVDGSGISLQKIGADTHLFIGEDPRAARLKASPSDDSENIKST